MTKFSDIALQFQTCEGLWNFPKSDMSCSTSCQPILIELTKRNSVDILTKSFWLKKKSLLLPIPNSQQKIRLSTHWSKQISTSWKVDRRVWFFSTFTKNSVKFQRWIFVNVNIRENSHFSNCKIFFRRMDWNWAYSSSIFRVKLTFVFSEVVKDGIWNTWSEDDGISIKRKRIISFETIVTIESI